MKREIIMIDEHGKLSIPANTENIWMSEAELMELFNVICPTIRAAIKSIYKSGILRNFEVERNDHTGKGCYVVRYNLQMIIALAFHVNSYGASKLREHILYSFTRRNKQPIVNVMISPNLTSGEFGRNPYFS